jgi:hypothetical protein
MRQIGALRVSVIRLGCMVMALIHGYPQEAERIAKT